MDLQKCVVLGASGVGKSELIAQFANYRLFQEKHFQTTRACYRGARVEVHTHGRNFPSLLQLWEIPGLVCSSGPGSQANDISSFREVLRGAHCGVVVCDALDASSLERLGPLVSELRAANALLGTALPIVLLINKSEPEAYAAAPCPMPKPVPEPRFSPSASLASLTLAFAEAARQQQQQAEEEKEKEKDGPDTVVGAPLSSTKASPAPTRSANSKTVFPPVQASSSGATTSPVRGAGSRKKGNKARTVSAPAAPHSPRAPPTPAPPPVPVRLCQDDVLRWCRANRCRQFFEISAMTRMNVEAAMLAIADLAYQARERLDLLESKAAGDADNERGLTVANPGASSMVSINTVGNDLSLVNLAAVTKFSLEEIQALHTFIVSTRPGQAALKSMEHPPAPVTLTPRTPRTILNDPAPRKGDLPMTLDLTQYFLDVVLRDLAWTVLTPLLYRLLPLNQSRRAAPKSPMTATLNSPSSPLSRCASRRSFFPSSAGALAGSQTAVLWSPSNAGSPYGSPNARSPRSPGSPFRIFMPPTFINVMEALDIIWNGSVAERAGLIFELYDTTRSGSISKGEFMALSRQLNAAANQPLFKALSHAGLSAAEIDKRLDAIALAEVTTQMRHIASATAAISAASPSQHVGSFSLTSTSRVGTSRGGDTKRVQSPFLASPDHLRGRPPTSSGNWPPRPTPLLIADGASEKEQKSEVLGSPSPSAKSPKSVRKKKRASGRSSSSPAPGSPDVGGAALAEARESLRTAESSASGLPLPYPTHTHTHRSESRRGTVVAEPVSTLESMHFTKKQFIHAAQMRPVILETFLHFASSNLPAQPITRQLETYRQLAKAE